MLTTTSLLCKPQTSKNLRVKGAWLASPNCQSSDSKSWFDTASCTDSWSLLYMFSFWTIELMACNIQPPHDSRARCKKTLQHRRPQTVDRRNSASQKWQKRRYCFCQKEDAVAQTGRQKNNCCWGFAKGGHWEENVKLATKHLPEGGLWETNVESCS